MPKAIELRWTLMGEDRDHLSPLSAGANRLEGQILKVAKPGRYEISARTQNSEGKPLAARLPFYGCRYCDRKLQSAPDWQLIGQLAKLNETAGGRTIAPESIDDEIHLLAERRKKRHHRTRRNFPLG